MICVENVVKVDLLKAVIETLIYELEDVLKKKQRSRKKPRNYCNENTNILFDFEWHTVSTAVAFKLFQA